MPYYVINHPVIVVLAVAVVQLPLTVMPKFTILVVSSILVTLLL